MRHFQRTVFLPYVNYTTIFPYVERRSMKSTLFLSHFTPSLVEPAILEEMFVQRKDLARKITNSVKRAFTSKHRKHMLFTGPRGIGKSHLIATIYNRINRSVFVKENCLIAWLREEEWGVTSLLEFHIRILRVLLTVPEHSKFLEDFDSLYEMPIEKAESGAQILLKKIVGERTLVLLVENLDDIIEGIGEKELPRFQNLIHKDLKMLVIATSPRQLFKKYPSLVEFFTSEELQPLSIDEAQNLLKRIATIQGNILLADFLSSSAGKNRVQAVHHLAAGNHRIYVIFSQFLHRPTIDELLEPLTKTIDELTPYYQARMQWISPQQRKIVEFLCDRRHAVTVKEIAQRCFISQQTASSQLKDLKEKGYVNAESLGRESYYELQEPLMRLCLEAKKNSGRPIRLFVEFLRAWYTPEELQKQLASLKPEQILQKEYLQDALKQALAESNSEKLELNSDVSQNSLANVKVNSSESLKTKFSNLMKELKKKPDNKSLLHKKAKLLMELKEFDESLKILNVLAEKYSKDIKILETQAECNRLLGNKATTAKILKVILSVNPEHTQSLYELFFLLIEQGMVGEAQRIFAKLQKLGEPSGKLAPLKLIVEVAANPLHARKIIQNNLKQLPNTEELLTFRLIFSQFQDDNAEVRSVIEKILEIKPKNQLALTQKLAITYNEGQLDLSTKLIEELKKINPKNELSYIYKSKLLSDAGDNKEAVEELSNVPSPLSEQGMILKAILFLKLGEAEEATKVITELSRAEGGTKSSFIDWTRFPIFTIQEKCELFKKIAREIPQNEFVLSELLEAEIEAKSWKEANETVDKLLEISKKEPTEILFHKATILDELAQKNEALSYVEKVLSFKNNHRYALALKGSLLSDLNRSSDAAKVYAELVELEPSDELSARRQILSHVAAGEADLGVEALKLRLSKGRIISGVSIVIELMRTKSYDIALKCIDLLKTYDETNEEIHLLSATCKICLKRVDGKVEFAQELEKVTKENGLLGFVTRNVITELQNLPEEVWSSEIHFLIDSYTKNNLTSILAVTFLRCLEGIKLQNMEKWFKAWMNATQSFEEFEVSMTIGEVVTRAVVHKDKKAIFDLPVEERGLAEEMIKKINSSA